VIVVNAQYLPRLAGLETGRGGTVATRPTPGKNDSAMLARS
jgi:hypothetical protein